METMKMFYEKFRAEKLQNMRDSNPEAFGGAGLSGTRTPGSVSSLDLLLRSSAADPPPACVSPTMSCCG